MKFTHEEINWLNHKVDASCLFDLLVESGCGEKFAANVSTIYRHSGGGAVGLFREYSEDKAVLKVLGRAFMDLINKEAPPWMGEIRFPEAEAPTPVPAPVAEHKAAPKKKSESSLILTEELIRKGMKLGIGIKHAQLAILGIPATNNKGWMKSLVGKQIPARTYRKFLALGAE